MKGRFPACLLAAALFAPPVLIGCDKEISHSETVKKNSDGSSSKTEKTVSEKPDGSVETVEEKKKER